MITLIICDDTVNAKAKEKFYKFSMNRESFPYGWECFEQWQHFQYR